jgi:hypothetical protein
MTAHERVVVNAFRHHLPTENSSGYDHFWDDSAREQSEKKLKFFGPIGADWGRLREGGVNLLVTVLKEPLTSP